MEPSKELVLRDNLDGTYTLWAPLLHEGPSGRFVVPAGFDTDLASVPRVLWWLIAPGGRHGRAAVCHDFLYRVRPRVGYEAAGFRCEMELARGQADRAFREAMREDGVGAVRAWTMWLMVRLFGWASWRKPGVPSKDLFE